MQSLLHDLRRLMPNRALSLAESRRVAELQANRLLEWRGVEMPPVPGNFVSQLPRIVVELMPLKKSSGRTEWKDGLWEIHLRDDEPVVRQRFSAAHELKHVIDHGKAKLAYPPIYDLSSKEREEKVADYFAACLLMPKRWVKSLWGKGVQDVATLAKMFDVSRQAMRIRLEQLQLIQPVPRCEVAA